MNMKDHEIVHFDLVAHLVAIYHIWRAHNGKGSSSFANLPDYKYLAFFSAPKGTNYRLP